MVSPDLYGVVIILLLLLPRPDCLEVGSMNFYWHICTDRLPVVSVYHSNYIPRYQSGSPCQSFWVVKDISTLNCSSTLLDYPSM